MIIDIHGHTVAPPELYAYQSNLLASRGAHGPGRLRISDETLLAAVSSHRGKPQRHVELLDQSGTDMQFISPRPYSMIHSERPAKIVVWYTRAVNDVIARQCRLLPDRFRGLAGLPQTMELGLEPCVEELERCVKELGFVGCLLNPDPTEGTGSPPGLGEEYWYPLYEKMVELDVPALIHSASCLSNRESYSLHFINEESIAIISLLNSDVFKHFPTLKLIVSHGGGAIPYQIGRFQAGRYKNPSAEPFEESMRRLYYDTALYHPLSLELLFKTVGVDRCMFGTENPGTGSAFNPNTERWMDDLKPVIESMEWMSEKDRGLIFSETARKVFNLNR